MVLAGLFLTFMLMSTVLEIVMVSRKKHLMAAVTYACSDIVRTLFFIVPAFALGSLRAVFVGATAFAALRLVLLLAALWRAVRPRVPRRCRRCGASSSAYALPFALAVGVEVIQLNYHQYVVALAVRRGDVRDLRRRLPADSAGRHDHDVHRQRDDGRRWPKTRRTARRPSRCGTRRSAAWRS